MKLTPKQDAQNLGLKVYYTGVPCLKGHLSERRVGSSNCIDCEIENKEHNAAKTKAWKKSKMLDPVYAELHRKKAKEQSKKYHSENRADCLDKMKVRNAKYYQENKSSIINAVSNYNKANKLKVAKYKLDWHKNKLKTDRKYKLAQVARRLLHRALGVAGNVKAKNTEKYHGYSSDDLILRLETTFTEGMSWSNYGEWHIDHIKPLKSFINEGQFDPAVINSLSNLQALWAKDNMSKGAKYEG